MKRLEKVKISNNWKNGNTTKLQSIFFQYTKSIFIWGVTTGIVVVLLKCLFGGGVLPVILQT